MSNPLVYEVNARILVERLAARGDPVRLSTVPDRVWHSLAGAGFEMVWLMGVWERSPASRTVAMNDAGLRGAYDRALPGWKPDDVQGSPYAIGRYALDPALGPPGDLAIVRAKLNDLGLGLIVDFVAGHLARDHEWTRSHPYRFVQGPEAAANAHPEWFFASGHRRFAHARDPNFGPWTDTVQTNLFRAETREALIAELCRVADTADGVRCDMAMLDLNDVFESVWRECLASQSRPDGEFWSEAIDATRARHPRFMFLAEAYWDLEPRLLELGFDFAYDKALYDRLRGPDAAAIRRHLAAPLASSGRGAHFVENHDEERAAAAFGARRSMAAATVALAVPGLRLVHDGQLEGVKTRLPVQLIRAPEEAPDEQVRAFHDGLLEVLRKRVCREGRWALLDVEPDGDETAHRIIAWMWKLHGERLIVAVNHADAPSRGFVRVDAPGGLRRHCLAGSDTGVLEQSADNDGTRIAMGPWEACVLTDRP